MSDWFLLWVFDFGLLVILVVSAGLVCLLVALVCGLTDFVVWLV